MNPPPLLHPRRRPASVAAAWLPALLATGLLLAPGQVRAGIQTVSYYRLGEDDSSPTSGGILTTADHTGAHPLTVTGRAAPVSRPVSPVAAALTGSSQAFIFEGSGRASGPLLSTATDNFGIEAWVKADDTATNSSLQCIAYNGTPGVNGWGLFLNNGRFEARIGGVPVGWTHATPGAWTYIALVRDKGRITFYTDGSYENWGGPTPIPALQLTPQGSFAIGASPADPAAMPFSGAVDELRVFHIAGDFANADLLDSRPVARFVNGTPALQNFGVVGLHHSYSTSAFPGFNTAPTIYNLGYQPLELRNFTITGPAAADFTVDAFATPVAPGSGRVFEITFTPSALGDRQATLTVETNDVLQPLITIPLGGSGIPVPEIRLSGPGGDLANNTGSLTLPPLPPGGGQVVEEITLRNDGDAPLTGLQFALCGTNAGEFGLGFASAPDLASGASLQIPVRFLSTAGGPRTAMLKITSDAPYQRDFRVTLVGIGSGPQIQVRAADTPLATGRPRAWNCTGPGAEIAAPPGAAGITSIATASNYALAVKSDGTVVAWGESDDGQLDIPAGLNQVVAVVAGSRHAVALKSDGTVVAWGAKTGSGSGNFPPAGLTGVTAIAAGDNTTVALKNDGTVTSWGYGPLSPAGLTGVTAISYKSVGAALKADGSITPWGFLYLDGPLPAFSTAIAAGQNHLLALAADGTVTGYGRGSEGAAVPPGLAPVKAIAAGYEQSLALRDDGTVAGWGKGGEIARNVPDGLKGVKAIATGDWIDAAVTDSVVSFDGKAYGLKDERFFFIRNSGREPLTLSSVTITGPDAGFFKLDATGMLTTLPSGAETRLLVHYSTGATQPKEATLHVVSNDSDEGNFDIQLSGSHTDIDTPLQAWRQTYFGSPHGSGSGTHEADPNRNGLTNLMEYALGGDPVGYGAGLSILPKYGADPNTGDQILSFTRYPARKEVTLTIQAADSPGGPWTSLAASANGLPFAALDPRVGPENIGERFTGESRHVTFYAGRASDPSNPFPHFLRLQVTAP